MIITLTGRGLGLDDMSGILLDFEFREILPLFKGAPLAVFLCIALHSDTEGHAYLKYETIMRETGYGSRTTISEALSVLSEITVRGNRVLHQYRERQDDGTFVGSNHYRIFPDDEEGVQSTLQSPESVLEVSVTETTNVTDTSENLSVQKVDSGLYKHPAFQVFLRMGGKVRNPNKKLVDGRTLKHKYAETIIEAVGKEPDDLEFWGRVVQAYNEQGWSAMSYTTMLEFYQRGCIPPSRRPVRHASKAPNYTEERASAKDDARRRLEQAKELRRRNDA